MPFNSNAEPTLRVDGSAEDPPLRKLRVRVDTADPPGHWSLLYVSATKVGKYAYSIPGYP